MALPRPIAPSQTDAKSPVDDDLMDSIREDLNYLYGLYSNTAAAYEFRVNGPLAALIDGKAKRADIGYLSFDQAFTKIKASLSKPGTSGTLELDLRKVSQISVPIMSLLPKFSGSTQSITRASSSLSTQTIAQAAAPQAVQSISAFKSALNINRIYQVSGNTWAIVTSADMDADWSSGHVYVTGATSGGNNGTFPIVSVASNGSYRLIFITNASGAAQSSAAGTVQLSAVKYALSNPADANAFAAGETMTVASCTAPVHNGTLTIYSINSGGSNVVVKSSAFAGNFTQGSAAGTLSCHRWVYNFSATPSSTYYVVGETLNAASHTSGSNDGAALPIKRINGNAITVLNASGLAQGGAAGTVQPNYWVYAFSSIPAGSIATSDGVNLEGHSNSVNDGSLSVKVISGNNVTVYNASGVAQGAAAGTLTTHKKYISFTADQSSILSVGKWLEISDCTDDEYNSSESHRLGFPITEVNFGGGANYNAVIDVPDGSSINNPDGYVFAYSETLLTETLAMDFDSVPLNSWITTVSDEIFIEQTLAEDTLVALYILETPAGDPRDLLVQIN
jgi:hypothetical protein